MIKKNAPKKFLKSNKLKKIKILAKKPERGGIPEIEKKIMMKDKAVNLLTLCNPLKLEIKKVCETFDEKVLK